MNSVRLRFTVLAAMAVAIAVSALASEPVDCFYAARATKKGSQNEIARHRRCAVVRDDGSILIILPRHLRALDFGSDGLATLVIEKGRWFYVKRNGKSLEVLPFDNGADDFSEGLVRGRRKGRIAFFDRSFRMVLPPKYDFAWPFEEGLASVCAGCMEEPAVASDREHKAITGGQWGYIDRHGLEVIAVKYSRDEAVRRKEALAMK